MDERRANTRRQARNHVRGLERLGYKVEHPGFGGDSILPRCSGLGGYCLPRYRRLTEPRALIIFRFLLYRTSVQLPA